MEKICFRCGIKKPLAEFYAHKGMGDGHLNKCKDCTKADSAKREKRIRSTPEGVESERKRHRDKYHRLGYKEKQKEWDTDRPWKNSSEYKGIRKKFEAKYGKRDGFELHHWNYNKIKSVILIHTSLHRRAHRQFEFDNDTWCYLWRGELLDTKHKHMIALNIISRELKLSRVIHGYEF
jgi:hypothetical protein